jgi:hypothetical protein
MSDIVIQAENLGKKYTIGPPDQQRPLYGPAGCMDALHTDGEHGGETGAEFADERGCAPAAAANDHPGIR